MGLPILGPLYHRSWLSGHLNGVILQTFTKLPV